MMTVRLAKKKKQRLLNWREIKAKEGIIVAASKEQEDLLPWWWLNYFAYNKYPVSFVDFGMSLKAKKWCKEKGELISLKEIKAFVFKSKLLASKSFPKSKHWFKKPLAMISSCYQKTLWLDVDCEVRGPLSSLFAIELKDHEIGMVAEPEVVQRARVLKKMQSKKEVLYNSGVVLFAHGSMPIERWVLKSLDRRCFFKGDQDLFSHLIFKYRLQVLRLPEIYNWLFVLGKNPNAQIFHFIGDLGKKLIRGQIEKLSNVAFLPYLTNI